ncbi:MAG: DNA mismatch repair protein MutS, partial [Pyrinomonadaceae bacterium]
GRINLGTSSPRDLVALRHSLEKVPEIKSTLVDLQSSLIRSLVESLNDLASLRLLIASAIADDPPINITDSGVVRAGFSEELDALRSEGKNAKGIIASLEERERARTGINTLKIRFNNVFGYYIEVSKAAAARVPDDYHRRQTLANAERYTMPELKELESRVLGAEGKIIELETAIYKEVRDSAAAETKNIQSTARALAMLDSLSALGETAVRRSYVRPVLHESDELEIASGRHPMIEAVNTSPFIPNDIYLNNSSDQILIITGPNMGGKSTVMRQTAIICILAQMGSFVPASAARLPVLDRIMTRVGASDDLSHGRSTFMVEMVETATILHTATPKSLVLLDEIGRGTSTFDGLSIAWAVAEYLHDSPAHRAKTLFATHYHELTELAERLPGAQNYLIAATEREGGIVFLYKLQRGRDAKSYGIEVAKLAGLPHSVLERAREVLKRLERFELNVFTSENENSAITDKNSNARNDDSNDARSDALRHAAIKHGRRLIATQTTLFDLANNQLIDQLKSIDVDTLTHEEAMSLLHDLKKRIV